MPRVPARAMRTLNTLYQPCVAAGSNEFAAGNPLLSSAEDPGYAAFAGGLESVLVKLSKMIVTDGEGATKFVEIRLAGARTEEEADRAARAVANSSLVKTAIHGEDANWGRILAAAGYSGVKFDPAKTDVYLQGTLVCRKGLAAEFSEQELKKKLDGRECSIRLMIRGKGTGCSRFWTCDFTKDYIDINASYRT